jgi:glycerophosphoryl diester phosphodiesterase
LTPSVETGGSTAPPPAPALADGPPWILGWRGAPLDEPENTLVSFRRALALGLDGLAWELRRAAGDELVVLADATLERTTNGAGPVLAASLVQLSSLDAGGWHAAERAGERIPAPEEVLALRCPGGEHPLHVLLVEDAWSAERAADLARAHGRHASLRIASRSIDVCRAARDAGAPVLWILDAPSARQAQLARDERFDAVGARPADWRAAPDLEWRAERWWIGCDAPLDLMEAVQAGSFGILTHEGPRAAFARAWSRLLPPNAPRSWPVAAPPLEMPLALPRFGPAWSAEHALVATITNPLGVSALVKSYVQVRRGAFEIEPEGRVAELASGAALELPLRLRGGSWRIGGDPLLAVGWSLPAGPGRAALELVCDTPLERRRTLQLDATPLRVQLVREGPSEREATMVVRLHRGHVHASIEDAGGAPEARALLRLGERTVVGGRGVRLPLPPDALHRPPAFSCGFLSVRRGERQLRRFCGGLLDEPDAGAPGRLVVAALG